MILLSELLKNILSKGNLDLPFEDRKKIFFACGAGMSTAAGIKDFRTPGTGLYYTLASYGLPDPTNIFNGNFYYLRPFPFVNLSSSMFAEIKNANPTYSHYFMTFMQEKGVLSKVFTQNIDTLEELSGIKPENIVYAHGSYSKMYCTNTQCSLAHTGDALNAAPSLERIDEKDRIITFNKNCVFAAGTDDSTAHCPMCGSIIKPSIVFFGDQLPLDFFEETKNVIEKDKTVAAGIILGTSLAVAPFNTIQTMIRPDTLSVFINREKSNYIYKYPENIVKEGEYIYYDKKNKNQLFYKGDCDEGILNAIKEAGYEKEFLEFVEKKRKEKKTLGESMKDKFISASQNINGDIEIKSEIEVEELDITKIKKEELKLIPVLLAGSLAPPNSYAFPISKLYAKNANGDKKEMIPSVLAIENASLALVTEKQLKILQKTDVDHMSAILSTKDSIEYPKDYPKLTETLELPLFATFVIEKDVIEEVASIIQLYDPSMMGIRSDSFGSIVDPKVVFNYLDKQRTLIGIPSIMPEELSSTMQKSAFTQLRKYAVYAPLCGHWASYCTKYIGYNKLKDSNNVSSSAYTMWDFISRELENKTITKELEETVFIEKENNTTKNNYIKLLHDNLYELTVDIINDIHYKGKKLSRATAKGQTLYSNTMKFIANYGAIHTFNIFPLNEKNLFAKNFLTYYNVCSIDSQSNNSYYDIPQKEIDRTLDFIKLPPIRFNESTKNPEEAILFETQCKISFVKAEKMTDDQVKIEIADSIKQLEKVTQSIIILKEIFNENYSYKITLSFKWKKDNKTVAAFAIKKVLAEIGSAFVVDWL